jgi:hypothetical protein
MLLFKRRPTHHPPPTTTTTIIAITATITTDTTATTNTKNYGCSGLLRAVPFSDSVDICFLYIQNAFMGPSLALYLTIE